MQSTWQLLLKLHHEHFNIPGRSSTQNSTVPEFSDSNVKILVVNRYLTRYYYWLTVWKQGCSFTVKWIKHVIASYVIVARIFSLDSGADSYNLRFILLTLSLVLQQAQLRCIVCMYFSNSSSTAATNKMSWTRCYHFRALRMAWWKVFATQNKDLNSNPQKPFKCWIL